MMLESIRIREYKNIRDSGEVAIRDGVTCLVGKNESGKTSLLEALYRLNPLPTGHPESFEALRDYPRRHLGRDRERVCAVRPIAATFALDDDDVRAVEAALEPGALACPRVRVSRDYENALHWEIDGEASADRSGAAGALPASERSAGGGLAAAVGRLLAPRLPGFLYFDEYSVMGGRLPLARLRGDGSPCALSPSERTALSLLRLAGTDCADFAAGDHEARKAALEGAANAITEEVMRYWSQNPQLSVELDVDRNADAPCLDIRIRNERHRITLNFDQRSQGFSWFFSFLATLSEVRRGARTVVLLDEPGRGLHAAAQADLLRFIDERLAGSHQVVYSTHSPFMVEAGALEGVRTVEDREGEGPHVSHAFFDHGEDTRLPLTASLGRALMRSLPLGAHTLLVESPSDHVYLTALGTHLEGRGRAGLDPRWSVVPVGDLRGVCAFAALLQDKPNVAILADLRGEDRQGAHSAMGRELMAREGVIALAEIAGTPSADIEDLFAEAFYVTLVNRSHAAAVEAFEVQGEGRIVARIAHAIGAGFNRYLPARFVLEHPEALCEQLDDATLDRFEALFRTINASIGAR